MRKESKKYRKCPIANKGCPVLEDCRICGKCGSPPYLLNYDCRYCLYCYIKQMKKGMAMKIVKEPMNKEILFIYKLLERGGEK